eukprot:3513551-Prorocentrum_lima.AAC.1
MTSSLVGSEMCIRDRRFLCLSTWKASSFGDLGLAATAVAAPAAAASESPVSYTHLTLPTICSV